MSCLSTLQHVLSVYISTCLVCLHFNMSCLSTLQHVLSVYTSTCLVCLHVNMSCLSTHQHVLSVYISTCLVCLHFNMSCLSTRQDISTSLTLSISFHPLSIIFLSQCSRRPLSLSLSLCISACQLVYLPL